MLTSLLLAALAAAPADSVILRVLTINDFHGALETRLYPWSRGRPVGGIAALKGMMDSLAAECRCPSVRLDAGDQMQGTLASNLVYGRSSVEALGLLGLDAAAIGNHELDWGTDTLAARVRDAKYPWLAANVFDSATGKRPAWSRPYQIITKGPYRIAVIGYLTPGTKSIVMDQHVRGLHFREGRGAIADVLDEVRAERPDFTMMVAHEGARCDSLKCLGEIMDLSRQFDSTAFDVIVAGHTHTLINTFDRGTPIVSARANGTNIGVVDLVQGPDGTRTWRIQVVDVYADAVRPDSAAIALVERYRPATDRLAKRVIARLRDSLPGGRGEFPLGNLIADAQRAVAPADFGMMNNGGIRRGLFPGPITYQQLFELHPFSNVVVRISVTGRVLKEALELAVSDGYPDVHVSGMKVRYDPSQPVGSRIVGIVRTNGTPVAPDRTYVLALSDFMAGGGGGFDMFRPLVPRRSGKTDLEAMIAWLRRQRQPVRAPTDHRWIRVTP